MKIADLESALAGQEFQISELEKLNNELSIVCSQRNTKRTHGDVVPEPNMCFSKNNRVVLGEIVDEKNQYKHSSESSIGLNISFN